MRMKVENAYENKPAVTLKMHFRKTRYVILEKEVKFVQTAKGDEPRSSNFIHLENIAKTNSYSFHHLWAGFCVDESFSRKETLYFRPIFNRKKWIESSYSSKNIQNFTFIECIKYEEISSYTPKKDFSSAMRRDFQNFLWVKSLTITISVTNSLTFTASLWL